MDLENRIFNKYYPTKSGKNSFVPYNHGVKNTGFNLMPNFFYDFGIKSPSANGNQRRYELSFATQNSNDHLPENHFRGLLGESLMRIVTMEFLRQRQSYLGINKFNILKKNSRTNNMIIGSENFYLSFCSRYNVQLFEFDKNNPTGEYDGIIEYQSGQKKGIILMEAKTGMEGDFANPINKEEKILKKYSTSIKELYPEHQIDLLFMGTKGVIYDSPFKKRKLRKNFNTLRNLLFDNNTGLIVFDFPVDRTALQKMGKQMAKYHTLRFEETPVPEANNHFVENGHYLWFMKGKRITKIFEKMTDKSWNEIYAI